MELSVTQENLTKALNIVGRVSTTRTGLPILGNILFRTEGSRLLVASTNLEIAATCYVGAKVSKQGELTLPARLVSDFIASLPKGTIDITSKNNTMTISSGNYSSSLTGVDASEFPELPTIEAKEAVTYKIAVDDFKQAVGQTIITASSDMSRPVLTGVYWHSIDGFLYLAGTDGYRLAERRLMKTKSSIQAIVPATSLQEALRTVSDGITEIEVLFDNSQVRFRSGESEITSRLIDGNYPDYRQLIPAKSETDVKIRTSEFARIVKIAGLFSRDSGGSVTLKADADLNQLSIHSVASELGENTSSANAKVSSTGQVTLNSRYIIDALGVINNEDIVFRFSGKLSPCVITSDIKEPDYTHIIMPLKS